MLKEIDCLIKELERERATNGEMAQEIQALRAEIDNLNANSNASSS